MELTDLLEEVLLACISGYVVVLLTISFAQRRWVLSGAIAGAVLIIAVAPTVAPPMAVQLSVRGWMGGLALFLFVLSAAMLWKDSNWRRLHVLLGWFSTGTIATSGAFWVWRTETKPAAEEVHLRFLPPLKLINYESRLLTELEGHDSLKSQITVYHVVDQKDYVSWVDAMYWAVLKDIAELGIPVRIYLNKRPSANGVFEKYLRAIAGGQVQIDQNVFSRFSPKANGQVSKAAGGEQADREQLYATLGAFARLSPIMFNCRHALILVWEGYRREVADAYEALPTTLRLTASNARFEGVDINLDGYRSGFMVMPTVMWRDPVSPDEILDPSESFCLGLTSYAKAYSCLRGLKAAPVRMIVHKLLAPQLSFWERPMLYIVLECVLLLRRMDWSEDRVLSTPLFVKLITFASRSVHYRIESKDHRK